MIEYQGNTSWRQLSLEFTKGIHSALIHQHHAVQLIALTGKYLIPQQPDDSNTNMQYFASGEWILGNELPGGFRIALDLPSLKMFIVNKSNKPYAEIVLSCHTKTEVFELLKEKLSGLGVDVSGLKNELHYEIPGHELDGKATFLLDSDQEIRENIYYRHNAEIILTRVAEEFEKAAPVRIWPHHFDTGTIIPLEHNDEGVVSISLGLGWAIPDSMVDEPYFYLSYWSENPLEGFAELPDPEIGEWIRTGWTGGVLKNSELIRNPSPEGQMEMVESFFRSGIAILNKHFTI